MKINLPFRMPIINIQAKFNYKMIKLLPNVESACSALINRQHYIKPVLNKARRQSISAQHHASRSFSLIGLANFANYVPERNLDFGEIGHLPFVGADAGSSSSSRGNNKIT